MRWLLRRGLPEPLAGISTSGMASGGYDLSSDSDDTSKPGPAHTSAPCCPRMSSKSARRHPWCPPLPIEALSLPRPAVPTQPAHQFSRTVDAKRRRVKAASAVGIGNAVAARLAERFAKSIRSKANAQRNARAPLSHTKLKQVLAIANGDSVAHQRQLFTATSPLALHVDTPQSASLLDAIHARACAGLGFHPQDYSALQLLVGKPEDGGKNDGFVELCDRCIVGTVEEHVAWSTSYAVAFPANAPREALYRTSLAGLPAGSLVGCDYAALTNELTGHEPGKADAKRLGSMRRYTSYLGVNMLEDRVVYHQWVLRNSLFCQKDVGTGGPL